MMPCKKSIQEADYLLLIVQGGIGRNIMTTAVVRSIKKAYPEKDIIVLSGSPEVFLKNPHVTRVISLKNPLFIYEDYIKNKKTVVINPEPYQYFDYVYRKKHFVECYCDMIGVPCDGIHPEMFFSDKEKKVAELHLNGFDKEMVLFQHSGGKNPKNKSEKEKIIAGASMYKRDLPKAVTQKIVDGIIARGYMVGSVQAENQFYPSSAEKIMFPIRAILALIPYVKAVIGIDSFLQHGSACFKKKSIVCWGGTNPKVLGYGDNINLTREVCDSPMCHRPNSYLFDLEITGFMWDCPHNDKCMDYKPETILEAFDKLTGGKCGEQRKPKQESNPDSGCHGCGKEQTDGEKEGVAEVSSGARSK